MYIQFVTIFFLSLSLQLKTALDINSQSHEIESDDVNYSTASFRDAHNICSIIQTCVSLNS